MAWGDSVVKDIKRSNVQTGNTGSQDFSWFGQGGQSGAVHDKDFVGKAFDKINPKVKAGEAAKAKEERDRQRADELFAETGGLNQKLDASDKKYKSDFDTQSQGYLSTAKNLVGDYTSKIGKLTDQSESQAKDATATYTNSILPGYKDAMSMAKTNADQAMTLSEAGDPNNPIMKAVRDLYNQQAEQTRGQYDTQGQRARTQGQQDFGVLSALGAQAAGMQFGAGPMTAGQQGQIYAQNQTQAGDAYARAQQRMYDLQQQGLDRSSDLQAQGLGKGFDQSNQMYEYGQDAQGRYSDTIKDLQGGENSYYGQQQGFRDEQSGYAGDTLGVNAGLNADTMNIGMMGSGIDRDNAYAGTGREQNLLNQKYGVNSQLDQAQLMRNMAGREGEMQFLSQLASMGMGAWGNRPKKTAA